MTSSEIDVRVTAANKSGAIKIRRYNSGGKGGQHSNKTENAVEMTHTASGIKANASSSKSQLTNRRNAWRLLLAFDASVIEFRAALDADAEATE